MLIEGQQREVEVVNRGHLPNLVLGLPLLAALAGCRGTAPTMPSAQADANALECALTDTRRTTAKVLFEAGRLYRASQVLDMAAARCPSRAKELAPLLLRIATALPLRQLFLLATDTLAQLPARHPLTRSARDALQFDPGGGIPLVTRLDAVDIRRPDAERGDDKTAWSMAFEAEQRGNDEETYRAYLSAPLGPKALVGAAVAADKAGSHAKARALFEIALGTGSLEILTSGPDYAGTGLASSADGRWLMWSVNTLPWHDAHTSSHEIIISRRAHREHLILDGHGAFGDEAFSALRTNWDDSGFGEQVNLLTGAVGPLWPTPDDGKDPPAIPSALFNSGQATFLPRQRLLLTSLEGFSVIGRKTGQTLLHERNDNGHNAQISVHGRYLIGELGQRWKLYDLERHRLVAQWSAEDWYRLNHFTFNPSMRWMAAICRDRLVIDTLTGEIRHLPTPHLEESEAVDAARFLDERQLYIRTSRDNDTPSSEEIWDVRSQKLLVRGDSRGLPICNLPETACQAPIARRRFILNNGVGKVVALPFDHGFGSKAAELVTMPEKGLLARWHRDETRLAVVEKEGNSMRVRVVDTARGTVLLDLPTDAQVAPEFLANGKIMVMTDTPRRDVAMLVDTTTWRERARFERRSWDIETDFSDLDTNRIVVRAAAGTVLLDLSTNQQTLFPLTPLSDGPSYREPVVLAPQPGLIGRETNDKLKLWSLREQRLVADVPLSTFGDALSTHGEYEMLDGAVLTHDRSKNELVRIDWNGRRETLLHATKDDPIVDWVSAHGRVAILTAHGSVRILDAKTSRLLHQGTVSDVPPGGSGTKVDAPRQIGLVDDARYFTILRASERLERWSAADFGLDQVLSGGFRASEDPSLHEEENDWTAVASSSDRRYKFVKYEKKDRRPCVDDFFRHDRRVKVIDRATGRTLGSTYLPDDPGNAAFLPDNRGLMMVHDSIVTLYRLDLRPLVDIWISREGMVVHDPRGHMDFLAGAMRELRPTLRCRLGMVIGPPEACEDAVLRPGLLQEALATLGSTGSSP